MLLSRLSHPICRDLAWIAGAPPLLDSGELPVTDPLVGSRWRDDPEQLLYALGQLDDDPVRLAELIGASRDHRLGSYYERLWRALLTLAPDVRVLAHNVAVREGQRSIGELDLVLETAHGAILHLELAIKFYLGRSELASDHQFSPYNAWWGPDPRDRLDLKRERLLAHQLPLAERHPDQLAGLPQIERSCGWLQGCLFYPKDSTMPAPKQGHVPPRRHVWCHQAMLQSTMSESWRALPHKRWLAPPAMGPGLPRFEMQTGPLRMPVMLVQSDRYETCDAARLLVMPDGWPDLTVPPTFASGSGRGRA